MRKIMLLAALCCMTLSLQGCGTSKKSVNAELSQAFDKSNELKSFYEESITRGWQLDAYSAQGSAKKVQLNSKSSTTAVQNEDALYLKTMQESSDSNEIAFFVRKRAKSEESTVYTSLLSASAPQSEITNISKDEMKESDLHYFNSYKDFFNKYKDCYTFTQEEKNEHNVISVKLKDSDLYQKLENKRMKKVNPDYDPLMAASGVRLKKHDVKHADYVFTINKDGYIEKIEYRYYVDYGDGLKDDFKTSTSYTGLNQSELNISYWQKVFEKIEHDEMHAGDTIEIGA